jgi:competence protein ComEA
VIGRGLVVAALVALAAPARAEPVAAPPSSIKLSAPALGRVGVEGVVNLNDAGEEALTLLPGIGPGKARAIVEHRRGHPFRRVDELTKVKGIGRKTFGRLRPYLTIAGPTTLSQEVKLRR